MPAGVTLFVGENGSGKSTVLEAIADLLGLPVAGGSKNEIADRHGPERRSPLAPALDVCELTLRVAAARATLSV